MSSPAPSSAFPTRFDAEDRLLVVAGEVGYSAIDTFRAAVQSLVAEGGGTVDLSGVTFMPSVAVGALVTARRRAQAAGVDLRLVTGEVGVARTLLELTGLEHDQR